MLRVVGSLEVAEDPCRYLSRHGGREGPQEVYRFVRTFDRGLLAVLMSAWEMKVLGIYGVENLIDKVERPGINADNECLDITESNASPYLPKRSQATE